MAMIDCNAPVLPPKKLHTFQSSNNFSNSAGDSDGSKGPKGLQPYKIPEYEGKGKRGLEEQLSSIIYDTSLAQPTEELVELNTMYGQVLSPVGLQPLMVRPPISIGPQCIAPMACPPFKALETLFYTNDSQRPIRPRGLAPYGETAESAAAQVFTEPKGLLPKVFLSEPKGLIPSVVEPEGHRGMDLRPLEFFDSRKQVSEHGDLHLLEPKGLKSIVLRKIEPTFYGDEEILGPKGLRPWNVAGLLQHDAGPPQFKSLDIYREKNLAEENITGKPFNLNPWQNVLSKINKLRRNSKRREPLYPSCRPSLNPEIIRMDYEKIRKSFYDRP